ARVVEGLARRGCSGRLQGRQLIRPLRRALEVPDLGPEEEALDLVRVAVLQRAIGDDVERPEGIERLLAVAPEPLLRRARELLLRGCKVLAELCDGAEKDRPARAVVVAVRRLPAV